ncbi:MAG: IS3 family transposase, partial [Mesorhizobium sp.]
CRVLEFDTSTYHYKSRRRNQAGIEARIKDICATRIRYGYRRVHVMLTREGWDINFVHDQLATGKKIRVLTVV